MRDRRWVSWAVPVAVLVVAAGLRLWSVTSPSEPYWDEQYYVFDASAYLGGGIGQPVGEPPPETIADEGTWVHPPMGKWMIALLGVGPIGLEPLGWRLPAVVFGVAGVGILYLLTLRLWRSVWWAGLAALLLALDGLHIVQSRMAMLDIFLCTFIVTGFLFLVLDHERVLAGATSKWRRTERWFGTPFRFWSGVFLGAAVATKWSGVMALGFAVVLASVWGRRARAKGRPGSAAAGILASFVLVPVLVYLASYATFFWQHGPDVGGFLTLQWQMLQYHLHHHKIQPENSSPWTWPLLLHPIQYFGHVEGGSVQRIVALGNPVLWWGFLALLPVAAFTVARRPAWQDAVAFGGYAALFLPWFFVGRNQFFFYALPMVPFMALCVVATLRRLPPAAGRLVGIAGAVAAGLATIAFAPLWLGLGVPASWLDRLAWLPRWR